MSSATVPRERRTCLWRAQRNRRVRERKVSISAAAHPTNPASLLRAPRLAMGCAGRRPPDEV